MNTDLATMSSQQLKVLGYEQFVLLQQTQNNLNLINAEIIKKNTSTQEIKNGK